MKKQFSVLILLICMSVSCKKTDEVTAKDIPATIIYSGDIAADGCGFLVKIDTSGTNYHADNLPKAYQKDNLQVIINYHDLTTKFHCGMIATNLLPVISIDAIRNK